jgi:hypothetical protein
VATQTLPDIMLDAMPAAGTNGLTEIPIAVTGTWKRGAGDFSITKQDLALMAANFRTRKNGEINVDYDHASEMPEVARGGPILSAGRIVRLRSNGALYAGIEFTARALQLIKAKEYRFVSPAIVWGIKDKATGQDQGATLTSLALTNRPFLEELPSIKLSEIGSGYSARSVTMSDLRFEDTNNQKLVKMAKARAQETGMPFVTALLEVGRMNRDLVLAARQEVLGREFVYQKVGDYKMVIIKDKPAADLSWLITQMAKERAEQESIPFSQALSEVKKENPTLAEQYRAQVMGVEV